jgi:hypothetical protein
MDGEDGVDGVSCTHEWNGTILTVTSASGVSSADLKGDPGEKGEKGEPGYTPKRGIDYYTEEDKAEMVLNKPQDLTEEQQIQARENIGADDSTIENNAEGSAIVLTDASNGFLRGLKIYGKTT